MLFWLLRHSSRDESHWPAMLLILKIHTQRPRLSLFLLPLTVQQRSHYFHRHEWAKAHTYILVLGLEKRKKKKGLSSHLQSLSKKLSCYHKCIIRLDFCFSDDQRSTTDKKMRVELYSTHQLRSPTSIGCLLAFSTWISAGIFQIHEKIKTTFFFFSETESYSTASFKLTILLPQPTKCWDFSCVLLHPA